MMKMHFFKKTGQTGIPLLEEKREATAQDLFCFLSELCEWSQSCPLIYCSGQEKENVIYILIRNFAFTAYDFWETFGTYFCIVNTRWKLDVFGTSCPSQETVWLSLEERDGRYYGVQNTVSGEEAETIYSLCLRIGCGSPEEVHKMRTLFQSTDWRKGIIVADWKYYEFFTQEAIVNHWENSCFCYGSILGSISPDDCLDALAFEQKVILWKEFLRDGFEYKEFEWLYTAISKRTVENRIEWELALHTAMQALGYTVQVSEHEFELYDDRSERKYLNFDSRQYAQMSLLKLLFPVNI